MVGRKKILPCKEKEGPVRARSRGHQLRHAGKGPLSAPESPRQASHCAGPNWGVGGITPKRCAQTVHSSIHRKLQELPA